VFDVRGSSHVKRARKKIHQAAKKEPSRPVELGEQLSDATCQITVPWEKLEAQTPRQVRRNLIQL
jgi:hypothetical protein